jgi:hypothetical protein
LGGKTPETWGVSRVHTNTGVLIRPSGNRVWTRGDGTRYKDRSKIEGDEKHIDSVWNYLRSNGKATVGKQHEFGSAEDLQTIAHNKIHYTRTSGGLIEYRSASNSPIWKIKK